MVIVHEFCSSRQVYRLEQRVGAVEERVGCANVVVAAKYIPRNCA